MIDSGAGGKIEIFIQGLFALPLQIASSPPIPAWESQICRKMRSTSTLMLVLTMAIAFKYLIIPDRVQGDSDRDRGFHKF